MSGPNEETTRGGGFEVTVKRGVYKTRGDAKVAAETKTIRNITMAISKAKGLEESIKSDIKVLKADLVDAKKRLKYWEGEKE